MGRLQYLERLALGRSAFQDVAVDEVEHGSATTEMSTLHDGGPYIQQYNNKGRPINPATEKRNQDMRDAQNAVLALVGVVESKDAADREVETQNHAARKARVEMLKAEQECGSDLEDLTTFLHLALTWWPETLISRVQAGIYASSASFAEIVFRDVDTVRHGRAGAFLDTFFPAAPVSVFYVLPKTLLSFVMEEGIGRIQNYLNQRLSRREVERYNRALIIACDVFVFALDIAFLPLQYHAATQRLGLAPARPFLPPWQTLIPGYPMSAHSFIWKPTVAIPVVGLLTPPAVLLLFRNFLRRNEGEAFDDEDRIRTVDYPPTGAPVAKITRLGFSSKLRSKVLQWFGWNLEYLSGPSGPDNLYENNYRPLSHGFRPRGYRNSRHGETEPYILHRSTALGLRPAQYVAERIDDLFTRLLMLPFEALVLRTIAQSFVACPLPKTTQAIASASHIYLPFGGGLLGALRAFGFTTEAWREVGAYVSRLGLSLAFSHSVEIAVFFVVYGLTRWQGMRNFGWDYQPPTALDSHQHFVDDTAARGLR